MTFALLEELEDFRRQQLPFMESFADFDALVAIGNAESTKPLGFKQMVLLDIAPATSLRRMLNRLVRCHAVERRTSSRDHRMSEYCLTEATRRNLLRYQSMLLHET